MKNLFFQIVTGLIILINGNSLYSQISSSVSFNESSINKTFGKEYFPTNIKNNLIYKSTFGDLELKVTKEKDNFIFGYDSDKFKYRQKLFVDEKGLFVNETYQKIKLLLFITKEGKYVYDKPLLRIPFPISIGQEWSWNGKEFIDGETHTVKLIGKAAKIETITTLAGKFETLKVESILETSEGSKNILTEWYAKNLGMVKMQVIIEGGGMLGFARDILGYGTIEFELKEIQMK